MSAYSRLIRPYLFQKDAEWAHDSSIRLCHSMGWASGILAPFFSFRDPCLETDVCGLHFLNPLGLAAGYDKSGKAVRLLSALGFGHLEIGSVSAEASDGNPKPRLWRLPEDQATVVHYGLPNDGADVIAKRLAAINLPIPLGINLVRTNTGLHAACPTDSDIIADYVRSAQRLKESADYLTLNLSCPNTETGRDFFAEKDHLVRCLQALSKLDIGCPVFLKISPLGGIAAIENVLEAVAGFGFVSGFIFNLSPVKPDGLKTSPQVWHHLPGAVSGPPCEALMNDCIREMYHRMDRKRFVIIGAGGVGTAAQAYEKIRLGSSLVQLFTALIYQGPTVVKQINRGLAGLLHQDGFKTVAEAVGSANQ
ncbi:MAG: quinone-dependent dihydroorotate dehydrogenase [bacterium]